MRQQGGQAGDRFGVVGRISRLLWPRSVSSTERLIRLCLAVAALAALAFVAPSLREGPSPTRPRAARPAGVSGPGMMRQVRPLTADGYARWSLANDAGVLMMPAVGPDGWVWAGEMGANALALFHPVNDVHAEFPFPVDPPAVPNGVTVDAANRVWIAQDGRHAIGRFDLELRAYREYPTPTPRSSPFGVATDGEGRVWFTELAAHQIGVFDPATERFREFPLPGDELHPYWLAVGNDGRVWFTVLTAPFVGVLDPAEGEIAVLRVPGVADRYGTTGIAVADDGAVWFGIRGGQLGRVDPVALTITTFPSPGDDAYGVAAGGNGLVWLATTGDEIYAFNPQAETFCPLKTGGNAWWVTAAADGSIWVAEGTRGAGVLGRVSAARAAEVCPAS